MNKQDLLQKHLNEVDTMADGAGYGIEPFIRRPVAIFRMIGLPTVMSCEGHKMINPANSTMRPNEVYLDGDEPFTYPWIWIDSFPQYSGDIWRAEWNKVVKDPIQFQELEASNRRHREKLLLLLEQSGYINNFLIQDTKDHFYNSFKFYSIGSKLIQAQLSMINFTEWIFGNEAGNE